MGLGVGMIKRLKKVSQIPACLSFQGLSLHFVFHLRLPHPSFQKVSRMAGLDHMHCCKVALVTTGRDFFFLIHLFIYLFIYLFLAVLGLCCCSQAFSSCGEWGLLFIVVRGLLIVVVSLVAEHRL